MEAIFGGGVATGRYAMGSNEPLEIPTETETIELDAEETPTQEEDIKVVEPKAKGESSKQRKRKRVPDEEASLMSSMTEAIRGFAAAVSEAVPGLYTAVMGCPSFSREALMVALGHLGQNKATGLLFVEMTTDDKDLWLRTYLAKNYHL
ncbi:hypothetical protein BS78_06G069100 [Paspalum vaginatum]|nr:hypothetical protein BS78_06G069100 [Paspalum vaginatum]